MNENILEVRNLNKTFKSNGRVVWAVKDVSFYIKKGETLAIVGESGCGKSTTGRMLLKLLDADKGQIIFKGEDISKLSKRSFRKLRPYIQIVFQNPYGSLNSRMTIRELLYEALEADKKIKAKDINLECENLIKSVELKISDLDKYPHQFSGGQRQRIGIARAIASKPDLIVCDEPVSALDLLVQAQMLNLLKNIQKKYGFAYLFISHDLSVVKYMSDRIAIMKDGEIIESGSKEEIFFSPKEEYTNLLLDSVLRIGPKERLREYKDIGSNCS